MDSTVVDELLWNCTCRYSGCIGDMASYDAFLLGGPYSVRGFNVGELAACRQLLETAVELRVPLLKRHAYVFWEYGTDLGIFFVFLARFQFGKIDATFHRRCLGYCDGFQPLS
jgi:Omp85 superfamily domain